MIRLVLAGLVWVASDWWRDLDDGTRNTLYLLAIALPAVAVAISILNGG